MLLNLYLTLNTTQQIFILLTIVIFFSALYLIIKKIYTFNQLKKQALDLCFIRILIPKKESTTEQQKQESKDFKEAIDIFKQLLDNIHGSIKNYIALEITAFTEKIHFHIATPSHELKLIEKQITALYPDAVIEEIPDPFLFAPNTTQQIGHIILKKPPEYPLKTYKNLDNDPLNNITNILSKMNNTDGSSIQILLKPTRNWQKSVRKFAQKVQEGKDEEKEFTFNPFILIWQFITFLTIKANDKKDQPTTTPQIQERIKTIDAKASQHGYEAIINIATSADTSEEAINSLRNIATSFNQFTLIDDNEFELKITKKTKIPHAIYNFILRHWRPNNKMILSTEEISSLFHLPDIRFNHAPNIKWQDFKIAPAPDNLPTQGVLLGHNVYRGNNKPIYIKNEDRFRHFYIIGQTGTGKSSILQTMIRNDLHNHKGFCVIDPHGDLIDSILPYVPKERINDTIFFNPADLDRPMGLNILEATTEEEQEFVSTAAMEIMIKLFGNEIFGPRLQDYFRNGVLTLMAYPGGGAITDIIRLFTDDDFQKERVRFIKNPIVKSFWEDQMAKTGEREKAEMIPYFAAKFGQFNTNSQMRNIVGQLKSSFDFFDIMQNKKILLINLSKGELGDINSKLLGLIITAKIQMAAMARQKVPAPDRHDFFLYIDEFQNYVSDSIESILSEARKYRLGLIMAHQYIGQLEQSDALTKSNVNLKNAVFGNVGTIMSYKIGATDAEEMAKEMNPTFSAEDLINIDKFKAAMRLTIDGKPSHPFSINVQLPWLLNDTPNPTIDQAIRELSRLQYGRDKKFVSQEIFARIGVN